MTIGRLGVVPIEAVDQFSALHHVDAMDELANEVEVVGDEQAGSSGLALKVGEETRHRRLNRDVQRCSDLIVCRQSGLGRENARERVSPMRWRGLRDE